MEPNDTMRDAQKITSGKVIEGRTDSDAADASSDGHPDYYLIDVDNENIPSGITIRLEGTDCTTCKAVNFTLIDVDTLGIVAAENSEQSTTRSQQVIQEEYNIMGDTYLKVFSSGSNREYDLTVWVNDGARYSAEVEPNNIRISDSYNILANGKEFKGNIIDTDDDDWIRFTPNLPVASFRVTAEGCDKDGTPESSDCSSLLPSVEWVVFNSNNQQLISGNTADDTTNQTRAFEVPIVDANIGEDHFIKFSSDHSFVELNQTEWSNRSYSVAYYEVANAEEDNELEPNDTVDEGQTIESGRTYNGNINLQTTDNTEGDIDHYIIDVESEDSFSGITVRLEAEDSNTAKAVHFELRHKNDDTLIASENAEQTVVNFSQQIIEAKYNIKGDAYLKVFSNQRGQEYKLTIFVDQTSSHDAEYEKNNTISEINGYPLLSSGKRIRGNISANNDVDYFKIDNPSGKATFFVTSEGCDIDGYGEDDEYFNQGTNSDDLCDSIIVSALNANEQTLNTIISDPGNANQVKSMDVTIAEGINYIKVESEHTFSNLQNQKYHNRTYEIVGFLPAAPPVTITSRAGNGGTISPQGNTLVPRSGTITYVGTPDDQYVVNNFTDTCDAQSSRNGNSYTISGVTKDCSVDVAFSPPVAIDASSTSGGSISPSGSIKVANGESKLFITSANSGFTFDKFTGTCAGLPSQNNTFSVTTQNSCSIKAEFKRIPGDKVSVTITSTGYPISFNYPELPDESDVNDLTGSTTVQIEQYTDLRLDFVHATDWFKTRELSINRLRTRPYVGKLRGVHDSLYSRDMRIKH